MKQTLSAFLLLLVFFPARAQDTKPPFWNEIQNFKKQDSNHFPPKHAILLIGSSSFTKWVDVQDYFPGYTIVNRGFGGSSLPHVIRYANDIIFPYQPKQILIYCGENDLAASDTVSAGTVFQRFKTLFFLIRDKLPAVGIGFISLKPSPSRKHLKAKIIASNSLIKKFLSTQKHTSFINVYHKMLGDDGKPLKEVFTEDSLHMNAKGYQIWQKIIQSYLLK